MHVDFSLVVKEGLLLVRAERVANLDAVDAGGLLLGCEQGVENGVAHALS